MYMYMWYSSTVYIEQRGAYTDCECTSQATLAQKFRHNKNRGGEGEGATRGGVALDEIENGAKRNANKVKI